MIREASDRVLRGWGREARSSRQTGQRRALRRTPDGYLSLLASLLIMYT